MTLDDVEENVRIQIAAFTDLDARVGEPLELPTQAQLERANWRHRHFIEHDPAGSWTATVDGKVAGCALALRRQSFWGLSLLVVDPMTQSAGVGRKLLDASLAYAEGCERATILASRDPRAIRLYATSGFALFPQMSASGKPNVDVAPASVARVREGSDDDRELLDTVDRATRGAVRGPDHDLISAMAPMYVVDDNDGRGYAYLRDDAIYLLAATDDKTAAALLWRCFRHYADLEADAHVDHMTAEQQWAIEACFAARLTVKPDGPVFWRGATPPRSYLPSGAFL